MHLQKKRKVVLNRCQFLVNFRISNANDNNSGGSGQQSVSVNEHGVANIDNNNGWASLEFPLGLRKCR